MAGRKRLVLFVEGPGDAQAVPVLVGKLCTPLNPWDVLTLDKDPFEVGSLGKLTADGHRNWIRWLKAAAKRPALGGVLLLLDGDVRLGRGQVFCAITAARELATAAREAGAGSIFSVAVVFACREYESWLIAGIQSLAGQVIAGGEQQGVPEGTMPPAGNLEEDPRDAKGWLHDCLALGYKPTRDQEPLTRAVDLEPIRQRALRSFRRLESALEQLVIAIRTGQHISSPAS
jgi:hypothetical protein